MTLSTTPAQGMGPNYHWLHGLSQPNLLHCTEAEARKLAAVDDLLEALKHLRHNARASGAEMGLALDVADAAIARALGEQA